MAFGLWIMSILPIQALAVWLSPYKMALRIPRYWHSVTCRIFGLTVEVIGKPADTTTAVLYASNHLSYLDIPALGSVIEGAFIAKSDIARWPVFGLLARLQRTFFIDRSPSSARSGMSEFQNRLRGGINLIVFPEGTSTQGHNVLDFKSTLFSAFYNDQAPDCFIQPITILLTQIDGKNPDTPELRDLYAWHRDMDTPFMLHLWYFAQTKGARLRVIFHPVLDPQNFENRKALAKATHEAVSMGLGFKQQQPHQEI
jgi:1-acyl-sn-glycerol-3-phosphate acyltransferase